MATGGWEGVTEADLRKSQPKRQKYGAQATVVDGITFHSKKEAARWWDLKALAKAGAIDQLIRQPRFELHSPEFGVAFGRILVGHYTADFQYRELPSGEVIIEDVKSKASKTEAYQLRKRMLRAEYGIEIRET